MSGSTFDSLSVVPLLGHHTFGGDNVSFWVKKDVRGLIIWWALLWIPRILHIEEKWRFTDAKFISNICLKFCFNLSECKLTSLSVLNVNCLVNRSLHTILISN